MPLVETNALCVIHHDVHRLLHLHSPPGFISGHYYSQSSEVVYSRPGDSECVLLHVQTRDRLELRDLSRSHDVVQGIAVAKKFSDMEKLLGSEVLNDVGRLNHPAP